MMAMERLEAGEKASSIMGSYGLCRTTIYKWMSNAKGRKGLEALRSRKAGGRPRKLTAVQERKVLRWINGKDPRQYGFDFGLWTRKAVGDLMARKFGVRLSLASTGYLLARFGADPTKNRCNGPMSATPRRSRPGKTSLSEACGAGQTPWG